MPAKGHGPTATFTPNGSDRFRPVILPHLRRSDRSASRRPVRAEHPTHGTSARPHAVWKTACFGWAYFGCKREHTSGRPQAIRPAQRAPRFSAQEGKDLTAFPRKSAAPDPPRKRPPACPTTTCSLSDSTSIYSDGILSLGNTSIYFDDILRIRRQHFHAFRRHSRRPVRHRTPTRTRPSPPSVTKTAPSEDDILSLLGNTSIHSDNILRIRRQHSHPLRRHPRQTTTSRNKPGPDLPHQALRKPPPPKTTSSLSWATPLSTPTTFSASAGNIPIHSAGIPGKPRHRETNQDPTFPTKRYENRPLRRRHSLPLAAPLSTPTTSSTSAGNILMHSDDIPGVPLDIENQPGPNNPKENTASSPPSFPFPFPFPSPARSAPAGSCPTQTKEPSLRGRLFQLSTAQRPKVISR